MFLEIWKSVCMPRRAPPSGEMGKGPELSSQADLRASGPLNIESVAPWHLPDSSDKLGRLTGSSFKKLFMPLLTHLWGNAQGHTGQEMQILQISFRNATKNNNSFYKKQQKINLRIGEGKNLSSWITM